MNLRALQFRAGLLVSAALVAVLAGPARAEARSDALATGFANPPNSAHPRVWWHWMNGNITKEGIQKDLEWMSRVGIGGVQNFDAALDTPQIVPERLAYMTPPWKDAFKFAVTTADRLGLEFAIAGSPGWSESGGPWVAPQNAMKKLVWSETVMDGGRPFAGALPLPPKTTGPFQTLAMQLGPADLTSSQKPPPPPTYYADVAVLAYRVTGANQAAAPAMISTGDGTPIDPKLIGDAAGPGIGIARGRPDAPGSIVIAYDQPQTIRSATMFIPGGSIIVAGANVAPALEAQMADGGWRKIADIQPTSVPTTVSFAPVTARRFRLALRPGRFGGPALAIPPAPAGAAPAAAGPMGAFFFAKEDRVSLFQLSPDARVNRSEVKAGFAVVDDYYALDAQSGPEVDGVAPQSVVDLTDKLDASGHLDWTPPAGRWKVLRFGYSLTGVTNHPATPEATGLEVDEYDGKAVRSYLETYLGTYQAVLGADLMGKSGLRAQVNDSTEVGPSNWTPELLDQFRRLRGYDARPWLPTLTGEIVGSRRQSDAFLYDFRRTLADLVASEHYGTIAAVLHEHGMIGYGEALESFRPSLGDDLAMRRHTDVPMAALWAYDPATGPRGFMIADMKGAASVAHVYGQNLTAAESMTSFNAPWAYAPSDLKRYIDLEFASGVNRPVIHTSVHQPLDKAPGLSLGIHGQYFNRLDSWAEMARPWVDYISRSAFLLQQGRNVADVAYFYGEEGPLISLFAAAPPTDAPKRYAYDFVNADMVLQSLSVAKGGELVTPGGARYKVLYLGGSSRRMTLPVLRRLAELVEGGATIVGDAPESAPGLADDPAEFARLVKKLWASGAVTKVGAGQVIAGHDVEAALQARGLVADFSLEGGSVDSQLLFVHRHLPDGDVYFLNNRKPRQEKISARFRVSGKAPELWRAETGASTPISYHIEGEETVVPLDLGPEDAVFVVFRKPAATASRTVSEPVWTKAQEIAGGWTLAFQPDRGAPATLRMEGLKPLNESPDPGVKYYSGTVTYETEFVLPRGVGRGTPLILDLGKVGDIAQVTVNGRQVGYAWKAPYRVNVGDAVRPGRNKLQISVANLWVNRLIGDAQPGAAKVAFTVAPTYLARAPLRPSGLIGPVTLLSAEPSGPAQER